MSSSTHIRPLERTRQFEDEHGIISESKREDEILARSIDWSDELDTSETVSSVAYVDSGVTTSGASLATPVSTFTVTGVGETEITATLSTGRKLQRVYRFYDREQNRTRDYNSVWP